MMASRRPITDLTRLTSDIVSAAKLADAPFDHGKIQSVVEAFEPYFSGSSVSFRTSTKARRELNVRYVELEKPHDPYRLAITHDLIRPAGQPIDELTREIQSSYPVLGYGVDLGAGYGLEKIWPFFPHQPQPLERACAMRSLPAAVSDFAGVMAKYDLGEVTIFGLDYRHHTVNLYFLKPPGYFAPERLAAMIGEFGFEVPNDELLRHCSTAVPIYLTFSWTSPRVERLCFAAVAPTPSAVPTHLHPVIARYVAGAPFVTERHLFIYNVTMATDGNFIKIENDYTGSMADLMRVFLAGPPPDGRMPDEQRVE
ncbi:aromatic prenyltransferase [Bradyrhizobium diazoefficiens]|uniref:aromatic prenyltransferase n=1 Tax=Bradyrhizobium diazoefficiens TaxID=1355477 RepID=UPI00359BEF5D